jgi:hypothetical protein
MVYLIKKNEKEYYALDYRDRDWIFDKATLELVHVLDEGMDSSWVIIDAYLYGHDDLEETLKTKTYGYKE